MANMSCDLPEPLTTFRWRRSFVVIAVLCFGSDIGCGERNAYVPPPPPEVVVGTPVERNVTLYHEFPGTTQGSQTVSIVPRVLGYIDSLHFTDGSFVTQGQLLFVIDPRPYQDAYDVALAQVHVNDAAYKEAQANYARAREVAKTPGAISKQDLDMYAATEEQAKANVELANANLANAKLNLDFTHITAPISGKISRRLVDVGNLVTANTTVLTTIDQYDPMYAYFNASEADFLAYLKRQRKNDTAPKPDSAKPENSPKSENTAKPDATDAGAQHNPVEMGLSDEKGYPHKGTIDFADNRVDPATGTISIRGVFPNPEPYTLAPGLFVRIRVPIGTQDNALLVPDRALGTDQQGKYLLMVGANDMVEHRSVETGSLEDDNLRVIESGVKQGERFIVEGLQFARAGSKVSPVSQTKAAPAQPQPPNQAQGRRRKAIFAATLADVFPGFEGAIAIHPVPPPVPVVPPAFLTPEARQSTGRASGTRQSQWHTAEPGAYGRAETDR